MAERVGCHSKKYGFNKLPEHEVEQVNFILMFVLTISYRFTPAFERSLLKSYLMLNFGCFKTRHSTLELRQLMESL